MARALAEAEVDAIFSYAGRTAAPVAQPLPTRVGGFGGVAGLQEWLQAQRITQVVDATHPFAAQMSSNAVQACAAAGVPLLAFERPAWQPQAGDQWQCVADIVFVESGGDNLAATFSPELSDLTIYVIDVAAGEKIPRKGGPGITKSDLFIINKTDLAPHVGANLDVMRADTVRMRTNAQGLKPFVMTNLKTLDGVAEVVKFIETRGMLQKSASAMN